MEVLITLKNGMASVFRSLGSLLKGLGGTLTAVAVAVVGIYGSNVLDRSRARDTDTQLYAQLMSKREDAETLLRKDMFNSIIGSFLKTSSTGYPYEQQVLNLELLAYNFHEALDLAPLFKHVYMEIRNSKNANADAYLRRLEKVASEVKSKQIAALEESGGKLDASINLDELDQSLNGLTVIDGEISPHSDIGGLDPSLQKAQFKVEALYADRKKKEIRIKLEVRQAQQARDSKSDSEAPASYSVFTISPFDFPMIDNTRLLRGQRCALVVRNFGDPSVAITLVYFPGSRASLKEKPFYDEAMHDLLNTRTLLEKGNVR
jgi:hypothetical protein